MDFGWDKESHDLSPWISGIVNGEHGSLRFVYLFQYEISGTIGTFGKVTKFDNLGKVGDIVAVRVRRKTRVRPDVKSMYDVEEMKPSGHEDSINEIRLEKKNVFINVNMIPDRREGKAPILFDNYLGQAYDVERHVPSSAFGDKRLVIVDILIKGDKNDIGRSFLEVVKYYGPTVIDRKSNHPVRKESFGLIRDCNRNHFFVWSSDYDEELKLNRNSKGNLELGSWISFDSVEKTQNGVFEIVGHTQPVPEQLKTDVRQGIVMIQVNSQPFEVIDGLPILETEGVGHVADSLHILRDSDIEYPAYLWLEPEQNTRYQWRVSRANGFDRKEKAPEAVTPRTEPSQGSNYGCIVTVRGDYGWIWSRSYPVNIRVLLAGLKDAIGKWVTFPEPTSIADRLYSRGPVVPLNREPIKTRIRNSFPELEVTLHSKKSNDSDGKPVYVSEEVGDVGDIRDDLRAAQLPVTVWVSKSKCETRSAVHWRVSTEHARRAPKGSPPGRRRTPSTPSSTFSVRDVPNQEERDSQPNDLIPRKNTDELSVSSTSDSCILPVDATDGEETPLHTKSLASLCGTILENPEMSSFIQKSFGKEFFTSFASAVLAAEMDE